MNSPKNNNIIQNNDNKNGINKKCSEILGIKYKVNYELNKVKYINSSFWKILIFDLIGIIIFMAYYFIFSFFTLSSKRPILCDITYKWPQGIFYGDRNIYSLKDIPNCVYMCDINKDFWTIDNNIYLSKLLLIVPLILRINICMCLLYSIMKKFHFLYVLHAVLQILISLISLYVTLVKFTANVVSLIWIFLFLLNFLESKSNFYLSILFFIGFLLVIFLFYSLQEYVLYFLLIQ